MSHWKPPCMDASRKTEYPLCKATAKDGRNGTCSIFVAMGCHGFYPSSETAKKTGLTFTEGEAS